MEKVRSGPQNLCSVAPLSTLLGHFKPFACLQIAFSPEPILHGGMQPIDGNTMTGFEHSVSGGKGVVEDGLIGKVAHSEAVDLLDGAGVARTGAIDALDGKAAHEHGFNCTRSEAAGILRVIAFRLR